MYAVIMAGGGGTRLWPLSRAARPKPFLPLLGDRTLIAATVERLSPLIEPRDVFVVTDGRYAALARDQLPSVPADNIVAEPVGRNTAAAVALATLAIDRAADEVMVVLPADHRIGDESAFRVALAAAAERATSGDLVTLGIRPTGPETGYGYILADDDPEAAAGLPGRRVERFVEKPVPERAAELLASGRASWNAGIFVWRGDAVRDGLARHAPDIVHAIADALAAGPGGLDAAYPAVRATSIDYALLEPASMEGRVAVVPADVGWSDLGSWMALLDASVEDAGAAPTAGSPPGVGAAPTAGSPPGVGAEPAAGSPPGVMIRGTGGSEVIAVGGRRVLVHATGGRVVAVVGLEDVVVVDTPDALLVCARDAAQDVRQVVDRLAAEERRDQL